MKSAELVAHLGVGVVFQVIAMPAPLFSVGSALCSSFVVFKMKR